MRWPEPIDVFCKAGQDRAAALKQCGITAHQQVQTAFGGLFGRAGHGRVEKLATLGHDHGRDFFGGGGHGGGAIDHDGAGTQTLQDTIVTQQHSLHLWCARDAQNDHIRLRRQCLGVGAGACACCQQGVQGLVARVFEDGEAVPVLEQVARDAVAHHANADHADLGHACSLE
jgi:hypothetical protein